VQVCVEENYDGPLRLLRQISLCVSKTLTQENPSSDAMVKEHVMPKQIKQNSCFSRKYILALFANCRNIHII
jgi:hypothetical protein